MDWARQKEMSEEIKSELWDYGGGRNLPIIFYVLCENFFQLHLAREQLVMKHSLLFAFWSKQIATQLSHDFDSCFAARSTTERIHFQFQQIHLSFDRLNYSAWINNSWNDWNCSTSYRRLKEGISVCGDLLAQKCRTYDYEVTQRLWEWMCGRHFCRLNTKINNKLIWM